MVDTANGNELGTAVWNYATGSMGIILDKSDHNVARQNPADYLEGLEITIKQALNLAAKADKRFSPDQVVGIGVHATGSTPIQVDENGTPLATLKQFKGNPNAAVWLWKDHTGYAEAAEITELARQEHHPYFAKCGGIYSSEWFFGKILHCLRVDKKVYDATYTWVEHADWIPAVLTGTDHPSQIKRCRCAAGPRNRRATQKARCKAKKTTCKPNRAANKANQHQESSTHRNKRTIKRAITASLAFLASLFTVFHILIEWTEGIWHFWIGK